MTKEVNRMPNIKSAKKRVLVSEKKALENKMFKSAFKTVVKKFEAAVEAGDAKTAQELYATVIKTTDKAAAKGIIHKNTAARKKSRFTLMLKKVA